MSVDEDTQFTSLPREIQIAVAKSSAPLEAEMLEDIRRRSLDQHAEMSKWLLASLLAINGGGAVAAVNLAGKPAPLAATVFAAGLLSALFAGYFIQKTASALQGPLARWRGYWLSVAEDGERDLAMEKGHRDSVAKATRIGRIAPALGFVSTGFFVAGAWALAHAR